MVSDIQLRSEKTGLTFAPTFQEALNFWDNDRSIWKMSVGSRRFVWKFKSDTWNPMSEERMCNLHFGYKIAHANDIFWIEQTVLPPDHDILENPDSSEDADQIWNSHRIVEVFHEEEFRHLSL